MTTMHGSSAPVADHPIGSRGRLTIRLAAAELRLAATDDDGVVVRTPNGAALPDRVVVETGDGGLTIREDDGLAFLVGRGRRTVQLEIDVPAEAEVTIEAASGWLDGRGLRGAQRYRLVSAETRLVDAAGRIELSTVSGDATLELADTAELTLKSVSGDLVVRGGRIDGLRIGTTSGDIRVESPLVGRSGNAVETLSGDVSLVTVAGLRVEARTISGDLTTDLPHRSEGRMGRRTLIVGDGSIELGFRSVSGDLRIHGPATTRADSTSFVGDDPGRPDATDSDKRAEPAGPRDPSDDDRMAILRALERGDLDVPAAMDRLSVLDATPGTGMADRNAGGEGGNV